MLGQELLKAHGSLSVHHRRNLGRGDGQAAAWEGASCLLHIACLTRCCHNPLQQGQGQSERSVHINNHSYSDAHHGTVESRLATREATSAATQLIRISWQEQE